MITLKKLDSRSQHPLQHRLDKCLLAFLVAYLQSTVLVQCPSFFGPLKDLCISSLKLVAPSFHQIINHFPGLVMH